MASGADSGEGPAPARWWTGAALGLLVLLASHVVFRVAPVHHATDSQYSMLLAENLLVHGDFALDRYRLPEGDYRLMVHRANKRGFS